MWYLTAQEHHRISMEILSLRTEKDDDYVLVGDFDVPPNGTIWKGTGTTKLKLIYSQANYMWVQFQTDILVRRPGFAVEVAALDDKGTPLEWTDLIRLLILLLLK